MKRIFLAMILILGIAGTSGFAQMGGGMMGGQHEPGMMEQKGQMMEQHKGMMGHGDMMNNMMEMMHQMSGMM